jgi:hypothetical protein
MTAVLPTPSATTPRDGAPGGWQRRDRIALLAVAVAVGVLAVLRWAGPEPFGSDNDEYRLLARSLWEDGSLLVAGVEGSKYPVGYAFLLGALGRLGLPLTTSALVLNGVLVLVAVALTFVAARRLGLLAGLTAAAVLALSAELWDSYYAVMPDVALVAVVIGAFTWLLRTPGRSDVLVLCAFAGTATLLKTLGITLGVALGAALLTRPGARRWAWAPPLTAVAVAGAQALAAARYPPAVTGYAQTFWLVDPGDAAQGRIGLAGLPARMWEQLPQALAEPGRALLGQSVLGQGVLGQGVPGQGLAGQGLATGVAAVLVLALLVAAGVALPRWRLPLLALWLSHTVLLSAWNFRGDRFGLPLIPLAAVGAGAVVAGIAWLCARVLRERTAVGLTGFVAAVTLSAYAGAAVPALRDAAAADRATYGRFLAASAELAAWAAANIAADEQIASVDYREISYRLDRPVLPVRYDRTPEVLLADTAGAGAEWFVSLRGLYGRREGLADTLVGAYPDRFAPVWSNGTIDVYRVTAPDS